MFYKNEAEIMKNWGLDSSLGPQNNKIHSTSNHFSTSINKESA